jgi:hypothetical protein
VAVNCIFVAGFGANHLELLPMSNTPANVVASSEDPIYPATNQLNRNAIKPWKRWQAAEALADLEIVFDKNQVVNGGAEANTLVPWETGGDVSVVGSPVHAGSFAFQLGDEETEPFMLQTLPVRAGEKITIEAALEALASGSGNVTITIEELGKWLDPDGVTWQDTETVWFNRTTNSMLLKTSSPVIPAYDQMVPSGTYSLSILIDGNDFVADSVAMWHWTDMGGIVGHNVYPVVTSAELLASSDNSSFTTVKEWFNADADPLNVLIWPTTFALFSLRGERWWKFLFNGVNSQPIWNGQCVLSQQYVLTRKPNYGIRFSVVRNQRRNEATSGADEVHVREDIERREIAFRFHYFLDSQWRESRNRMLRQSLFGKHPLVLIYDDTNADAFAMVRQPGRFDYMQAYMQSRHADDFIVRELAFPTGD